MLGVYIDLTILVTRNFFHQLRDGKIKLQWNLYLRPPLQDDHLPQRPFFCGTNRVSSLLYINDPRPDDHLATPTPTTKMRSPSVKFTRHNDQLIHAGATSLTYSRAHLLVCLTRALSTLALLTSNPE